MQCVKALEMQLVDQAEQGLRLACPRWPVDRHEARAAGDGTANRQCLRGVQLRHTGARELFGALAVGHVAVAKAQQLVRESGRDVAKAPDGLHLSAARRDAHVQHFGLDVHALEALSDDARHLIPATRYISTDIYSLMPLKDIMQCIKDRLKRNAKVKAS